MNEETITQLLSLAMLIGGFSLVLFVGGALADLADHISRRARR